MNNDLTAGKPGKLILMFTLPLLIGNLFQQFYSMADTIIVGRTIDVYALAARRCNGRDRFLILGFVQGVTSGFSVITAPACRCAGRAGRAPQRCDFDTAKRRRHHYIYDFERTGPRAHCLN